MLDEHSKDSAMAADTSSTAAPFRIGMLIFPGLTNLDFAAPLDVFGRMPNTEVHVLARTLEPVRSDIGFPVLPTRSMADAPRLDLLFVGGGPGINALLDDAETLDFLAARAPEAQWITSVCTGALVLGAAGLLRGYKATTHWTAMEALRPFGAEPTNQRVVIDRNRVTGGGVTAGVDFGLTIAALLHGEAFAHAMQLGMEYEPAPPFRGGSASTAPSELVERVKAQMAPGTAMRVAAAERIARARGWL